MKSKGIFIKENIAKLSVEPTLVSLSDCPNFVEFSKIDEDDKLFYLKIVGDGYKDYSTKPVSTMIFSNRKDLHFFIPTHKNAPNNTGFNSDSIKTFKFDITDATNDEIAASLKKSLVSSEIFSSFNINQVKDIDGEEDEKGTIVRFTAKENMPKTGFIFLASSVNDYEKFQTQFAEYSTNPFEEIVKENELQEIFPKRSWTWKVIGDITYNLPLTQFTITSLFSDTKYQFKGHKSESAEKYVDENGVHVYLYPYADSKIQNATNLVSAMNNTDFLHKNFNIYQKKDGDELTTEIVFENKTQSYYSAFQFEALSSLLFRVYLDIPAPNPFEEHNDLMPQYNPDKQEIALSIDTVDVNDTDIEQLTSISFVDEGNESHLLWGTKEQSKISSTIFHVDSGHKDSKLMTAENIKNCIKRNSYLNNNYQVELRFEGGAFKPIIVIKAIDSKKNNNLKVKARPQFITFVDEYNQIFTHNSDSISPNAKDTSIEIEVYNTNNDSFLGENNYPENSMGTYMTTLRKAYHGQPLWFDLNTLISNKNTFSNNFLEGKTWYDAGTAVNYRFVARRWDGVNRDPIYLSDVLHSITGYGRNLDENDLEKYIYNAQVQNTGMSPLTHKTKLTHIEGQSQYFNFILQDADRTKREEKDFSLIYRLYTQSGKLIEDGVPDGKYKRQAIAKSDLNIVNTIKLEIDEQINEYKKMLGDMAKEIGYAKVSLCHTVWDEEIEDEKTVRIKRNIESQFLEFKILPKCLHKINDFAFLNALGGWSSFNFGGEERTDFRASGNNIFKTQTPHYKSSNEIESVQNQDIKEVFSAKTSPIDSATVEWLKEMSASVAVYELSTNRYIIVDEMNIQPNTKNELFTVEMKYRYSDSFNGRIK